MFNKYYHDELTFLRELGSEFAQANPRTANLLSEYRPNCPIIACPTWA